jgi:hypothetical protein
MQLRSVKMSQAISLESDKAVTQTLPTMEERIEQANQEALELIKTQVLKQVCDLVASTKRMND